MDSQAIFNLIIAAGVIAFAVGQFRNGKNTAATSTIALLQNQVSAFEKETNRLRDEVRDQGKHIARLEGEGKTKDAEIERYRKIFENRDPDLQNTLKTLAEFMNALRPVMEKMNSHLDKEHPMMQ